MKPQCETVDVVPQQPASANDLRQPQSIDERSKAEEATVDQAPRPGPREAMPRPLELPSFDPGTIFVDFFAYLQDAAERSVLFWDTLRRRAENMVAHERAGKPPLLDFDYEVLLDARRFEHQANYALLRVTGVGDACIEDCLEETKPPVIVIDPRAGHGPGIGGFKQDSEVGIALREGYPVYFVMFYPEPVAGQTLADVLHTLRRFLENVARRHPGKAPVLYGNCQAGWAAALLAADCEGLSGPTVLNGSPLSYWAGVPGMNPMRIAGGLVGGAWLTHFLADLGNGRFDGAWLVQNFEGLKPETVWEKYAHLFAEVDTERDRFLEFERWWSGFYFLSREEILAIVENLFIGNRLEEGRVRICEGCEADLRRIRNPLIIFASYGDNITPPHQALGWVPAVYKDTADLKRAGQRIVYLTNPHVGHLGIFVSAKVARREHRAILQSLGRIQALPPGLYEMKITDPVGDPDCHDDAYAVRFEERDVADIQFPTQSAAFERVRELSERNEALYTTFVSPWVQAFATPWSAAVFEQLHPLRASRYLLSGAFMPWMRGMAGLATFVNEDRHSIRSDNPFKALETEILSQVGDAVEVGRKVRDAVYERNFDQAYGAMPMTRRLDEPPQGNSPGPSVAPAQHNRYRAGARRTQQNQRVEGDT